MNRTLIALISVVIVLVAADLWQDCSGQKQLSQQVNEGMASMVTTATQVDEIYLRKSAVACTEEVVCTEREAKATVRKLGWVGPPYDSEVKEVSECTWSEAKPLCESHGWHPDDHPENKFKFGNCDEACVNQKIAEALRKQKQEIVREITNSSLCGVNSDITISSLGKRVGQCAQVAKAPVKASSRYVSSAQVVVMTKHPIIGWAFNYGSPPNLSSMGRNKTIQRGATAAGTRGVMLGSRLWFNIETTNGMVILPGSNSPREDITVYLKIPLDKPKKFKGKEVLHDYKPLEYEVHAHEGSAYLVAQIPEKL